MQVSHIPFRASTLHQALSLTEGLNTSMEFFQSSQRNLDSVAISKKDTDDGKKSQDFLQSLHKLGVQSGVVQFESSQNESPVAGLQWVGESVFIVIH